MKTLFDLPTPSLVLNRARLERNCGRMAEKAARHGLDLRPHLKTAIIAVLSGLLPLGIAHPCYNYAQMHLGASYCGTLVLFTPAGTYLLSAIFLPEETLRPLQLAGAGLLILGTVAVTLAHRRVVRPRVVASVTLAPIVEAGN